MAEIVLGYSASHAPMMSANPDSAPPAMKDRFFAALDQVRDRVTDSGAKAVVSTTAEY